MTLVATLKKQSWSATEASRDLSGSAMFTRNEIAGYPVSSTRWNDVLTEVRNMRYLQDDWDGDGSLAPSVEVVDSAIAYGSNLRQTYVDPPDRVIAGVNGTVIFEWSVVDRIRQCEICSPDRVRVSLGNEELTTTTQDCGLIH